LAAAVVSGAGLVTVVVVVLVPSGVRVVVFCSQPARRPTDAIVAMETDSSERRRVGFMRGLSAKLDMSRLPARGMPESRVRPRLGPPSYEGAAFARANGLRGGSARRGARHDLAQQLDQSARSARDSASSAGSSMVAAISRVRAASSRPEA
jgi:hypothetical protein